jgi:hypothetical protein
VAPRVPQRVRQITQTLGIVGIAFLIALALFLLFYFTGHGVLLAFDILALIPLGAIMAFRAFRFAQRNMLRSLRNRLLFIYGLFGVLPPDRSGSLLCRCCTWSQMRFSVLMSDARCLDI